MAYCEFFKCTTYSLRLLHFASYFTWSLSNSINYRGKVRTPTTVSSHGFCCWIQFMQGSFLMYWMTLPSANSQARYLKTVASLRVQQWFLLVAIVEAPWEQTWYIILNFKQRRTANVAPDFFTVQFLNMCDYNSTRLIYLWTSLHLGWDDPNVQR
jgi:hypothetical protein